MQYLYLICIWSSFIAIGQGAINRRNSTSITSSTITTTTNSSSSTPNAFFCPQSVFTLPKKTVRVCAVNQSDRRQPCPKGFTEFHNHGAVNNFYKCKFNSFYDLMTFFKRFNITNDRISHTTKLIEELETIPLSRNALLQSYITDLMRIPKSNEELLSRLLVLSKKAQRVLNNIAILPRFYPVFTDFLEDIKLVHYNKAVLPKLILLEEQVRATALQMKTLVMMQLISYLKIDHQELIEYCTFRSLDQCADMLNGVKEEFIRIPYNLVDKVNKDAVDIYGEENVMMYQRSYRGVRPNFELCANDICNRNRFISFFNEVDKCTRPYIFRNVSEYRAERSGLTHLLQIKPDYEACTEACDLTNACSEACNIEESNRLSTLMREAANEVLSIDHIRILMDGMTIIIKDCRSKSLSLSMPPMPPTIATSIVARPTTTSTRATPTTRSIITRTTTTTTTTTTTRPFATRPTTRSTTHMTTRLPPTTNTALDKHSYLPKYVALLPYGYPPNQFVTDKIEDLVSSVEKTVQNHECHNNQKITQAEIVVPSKYGNTTQPLNIYVLTRSAIKGIDDTVLNDICTMEKYKRQLFCLDNTHSNNSNKIVGRSSSSSSSSGSGSDNNNASRNNAMAETKVSMPVVDSKVNPPITRVEGMQSDNMMIEATTTTTTTTTPGSIYDDLMMNNRNDALAFSNEETGEGASDDPTYDEMLDADNDGNEGRETEINDNDAVFEATDIFLKKKLYVGVYDTLIIEPTKVAKRYHSTAVLHGCLPTYSNSASLTQQYRIICPHQLKTHPAYHLFQLARVKDSPVLARLPLSHILDSNIIQIGLYKSHQFNNVVFLGDHPDNTTLTDAIRETRAKGSSILSLLEFVLMVISTYCDLNFTLRDLDQAQQTNTQVNLIIALGILPQREYGLFENSSGIIIIDPQNTPAQNLAQVFLHEIMHFLGKCVLIKNLTTTTTITINFLTNRVYIFFFLGFKHSPIAYSVMYNNPDVFLPQLLYRTDVFNLVELYDYRHKSATVDSFNAQDRNKLLRHSRDVSHYQQQRQQQSQSGPQRGQQRGQQSSQYQQGQHEQSQQRQPQQQSQQSQQLQQYHRQGRQRLDQQLEHQRQIEHQRRQYQRERYQRERRRQWQQSPNKVQPQRQQNTGYTYQYDNYTTIAQTINRNYAQHLNFSKTDVNSAANVPNYSDVLRVAKQKWNKKRSKRNVDYDRLNQLIESVYL